MARQRIGQAKPSVQISMGLKMGTRLLREIRQFLVSKNPSALRGSWRYPQDNADILSSSPSVVVHDQVETMLNDIALTG